MLEGNLTSFHFISSFKACFTNLECFLCEYLQISMLQSIENIKNVWSVYFYFNTLSCQNYFFPESMGGVQNSSGNSGGVGGLFYWSKMEILGRGGGLREIPSVVGVWIFSGTTQCIWVFTDYNCFLNDMKLSIPVRYCQMG